MDSPDWIKEKATINAINKKDNLEFKQYQKFGKKHFIFMQILNV